MIEERLCQLNHSINKTPSQIVEQNRAFSLIGKQGACQRFQVEVSGLSSFPMDAFVQEFVKGIKLSNRKDQNHVYHNVFSGEISHN